MIWAIANKSTVKLASCVYDGRNLVPVATAAECFSIKKKKKKVSSEYHKNWPIHNGYWRKDQREMKYGW